MIFIITGIAFVVKFYFDLESSLSKQLHFVLCMRVNVNNDIFELKVWLKCVSEI
jgi:hypothetical protein